MANALFAFDSPGSARGAADRLLSHGLPSSNVQLYSQAAPGGFGRQVDEQVTGGLLGNLLDLFQGLFDWSSSPHDASAYEEAVLRGGAVLSVNAPTAKDQTWIEAEMQDAARHTGWSHAPSR